jgi:hypothetical protein
MIMVTSSYIGSDQFVLRNTSSYIGSDQFVLRNTSSYIGSDQCKFVSNFQEVSSFLQVLWFPPSIKLATTI